MAGSLGGSGVGGKSAPCLLWKVLYFTISDFYYSVRTTEYGVRNNNQYGYRVRSISTAPSHATHRYNLHHSHQLPPLQPLQPHSNHTPTTLQPHSTPAAGDLRSHLTRSPRHPCRPTPACRVNKPSTGPCSHHLLPSGRRKNGIHPHLPTTLLLCGPRMTPSRRRPRDCKQCPAPTLVCLCLLPRVFPLSLARPPPYLPKYKPQQPRDPPITPNNPSPTLSLVTRRDARLHSLWSPQKRRYRVLYGRGFMPMLPNPAPSSALSYHLPTLCRLPPSCPHPPSSHRQPMQSRKGTDCGSRAIVFIRRQKPPPSLKKEFVS